MRNVSQCNRSIRETLPGPGVSLVMSCQRGGVRSSARRKPVHTDYAKLDSAGWACSDGEVDEQAEASGQPRKEAQEAQKA